MASSKRGYLTIDELEEFADITVTDEVEAYDRISQAEELIDDFVGFQKKANIEIIEGKVSESTATDRFTLEAAYISAYQYTDYFKGMHVEIVGGTGIGQQRKIISSSSVGVLIVEAVFSPQPDTTSIYRIYQIGKFPRRKDVFVNTRETPTVYYPGIPEDVKRAVAAQVQYMINMGDRYFASDGEEVSERIGDYAVTRKEGGGGIRSLIAPKARHLLRGIMNRTGILIA